ncbi:sigma-70 family RNA polymerase sigma factor [Kitasatospora sp. NPDC127111]|uniref:sigma-70 family RNA polymerase sigma factor n=1 Tax=Kitasatospora sp. NPDC127111 TaxID=3345363 RepID=UPI00363C5A29
MAAPGRSPRWDEQLQRRLARGEETALGELYDQLAPMVHGLAGRILADEAAAAQLTREIFAHVWEHPHSFDPAQGSLRSWIGSLTHRRAVDRLRIRRAAEGEGLDQGTGGAYGGSRPDGDPYGGSRYDANSPVEEEIRTVATAARIQYVVDSLPQTLRETITVSYYGGRTYQETARRLGISEQIAKQRMRLGLELLATELAEERERQQQARQARQAQQRGHRPGGAASGGHSSDAAAPDRPEPGAAGPDEAAARRAEHHGAARRDTARRDTAPQDATAHDEAAHGRATHDGTAHDEAVHDEAVHDDRHRNEDGGT